MPILSYTPQLFDPVLGAPLAIPSDLSFSWEELIRAAITVGRRNWDDVLLHGTYSVLEAIWRVAMVRSSLVERPDGRLRWSSSFIALDPSEKSAVSYFVGLVYTKLLAEKLFGVPWLLHLDVYKKLLNITLLPGHKPDFVGLDGSQQWLVAESKGRTHSVPAKLMQKAKKQVEAVASINGQAPAIGIAVGTAFQKGNPRTLIWDPEADPDHGYDLSLRPAQLLRAYYQPLAELIERLPPGKRPHPEREQGRWVDLAGMDVELSVDPDILLWLDGGADTALPAITQRQPASVLEVISRIRRAEGIDRERQRAAVALVDPVVGRSRLRQVSGEGLDGVSIAAGESWTPERMRREPPDRAR